MHRLNQTVDVVVYKLTVANTVEERILALQEKKRALAQAAVEGGKAIGKLDMKDIMQLFQKNAEGPVDVKHVGLGKMDRVLDNSQGKNDVETTPVEEARRREREKGSSGGTGKASGEKRNEHAVYGRRW